MEKEKNNSDTLYLIMFFMRATYYLCALFEKNGVLINNGKEKETN